jgi:hypothetical protein
VLVGVPTLILSHPDRVDDFDQRAMGHADMRILARYQDVVSELQRDAAAKMDALLGVSPKVSPDRGALSTQNGL